MAGARGVAAQLGVGNTSTVDKALNFVSESLALTTELLDLNGMRGTRSRQAELVREGRKRVGGNITINPTPVDLAYLLPKIMGAAASGTTYALAETIGTFYCTVDRVSKVFTYSTVGVTRATFSCTPGAPLALSMDCIGVSESVGNSGTYPSISVDTTTKPFVMSDLAITVGGTTVTPAAVSFTIDNAINTERFFNSQTMASIDAMDRNILVSLTLPYGTDSSSYASASTGIATVATFTNGAVSIIFTFAGVAYVTQSPTVGDRGEIMLQLNGEARKSSSTEGLVITLDSTP